MKKLFYTILIILLIFSCKTTSKNKTVKPVYQGNTLLHYKDMPNGFADINFILFKNNTFKISVFVLSDKSSASFEGSWKANKNNLELSFNKVLSNDMIKNIFDPSQNKANGINIDINSYKSVIIPRSFSQIWLYNVLCGKK